MFAIIIGMKDKQIIEKAVLSAAELMYAAAITAPKGKGADLISVKIISGAELDTIAELMEEAGTKYQKQSFVRDAGNLRGAQALVLIGSKVKPLNLAPCGFCGYESCAELVKNKGICTFNTVDLGIALGSAVSVAAMHHIDNRVMYTIPFVLKENGLLDENFELCFAVPLSVSNKSIFFDR